MMATKWRPFYRLSRKNLKNVRNFEGSKHFIITFNKVESGIRMLLLILNFLSVLCVVMTISLFISSFNWV